MDSKFAWLKDLASQTQSSKQADVDACRTKADKFYSTVLQNLADPNSALSNQMKTAVKKGRSCIELTRPKFYSSSEYKQEWDCAYKHTNALNAQIKRDLPGNLQFEDRWAACGGGDSVDLLYLCWSQNKDV